MQVLGLRSVAGLVVFTLWASICPGVALNCALPEPQLLGVRNATAVKLPVDIMLTTMVRHDGASSEVFAVATHNSRSMPWHEKVTIERPGRRRILAATTALNSACSRTDFFVFDGYLPPGKDSEADAEPPTLECQHPEFHLIIFWSAMGDDQTSQHLRILAALSDVVNYPEADYHLQLRATFRVDPGERHRFNEDWYRDFYGETYYGLYFGSPQKVDMVDVKGDGAFHVALLEDLCPKYAFDLERNMVLNTNTFAVKKLLRQHSPRWFQVHATQTQQESDTDYRHLFGSSGREVFRNLQLSKRHTIVEQHGLQVDQAIYVLPWRRIFIPVDAMETLGVIMQSEWYRFELDVAELHAELSEEMLHPDVTSSQENIHRAAFLGSSRLPLLAHLPVDTQWYKGMLALEHVKAFRVLKENSWKLQLPPCSTIEEAATALSAQNSSPFDEDSLQGHVQQLQHRIDHFNHTVVAVGASVDGPFTIWDGNHRAIALALTQPSSHLLLVYIGISARFATPHTGSHFCP